MTGVNTLFNALLNDPRISPSSTSARCVSLGGGMAVQKAVADKWKQVTGKPLIEAYGLTETSPAATINPLDLKEYNGSIGLPVPSTEVAIRDDAGNDVPIGEPASCACAGPQVMKGYYNRPGRNRQGDDADGFLRTGDVAVMDEKGFVRIVDRKKDMILVSGFNVYPNEVEAVVAMHPGVLEVAAVGVPDEKSGEAVKVFIVKKDPGPHRRGGHRPLPRNLTGYKVPRSSSSAPNCRRPTSARSCAGRCATSPAIPSANCSASLPSASRTARPSAASSTAARRGWRWPRRTSRPSLTGASPALRVMSPSGANPTRWRSFPASSRAAPRAPRSRC
jgi:acyl-CoA synthetase (AMP-forming)/AMP-acid ligase II